MPRCDVAIVFAKISLCCYTAQSIIAVRISLNEQADLTTNSTNGTELAAVVRTELLYEQGCM